MLRATVTEVVDAHGVLLPSVTKLILAMFREVEGSPGIALRHLPDVFEEVFRDDPFLAYEALANVMPLIHTLHTRSYHLLL